MPLYLFLHHMKRSLGLKNINVSTARIAGKPEQEKLSFPFDLLTFRAVSPEQILPIADNYLAPRGTCLYWGTSEPPPIPQSSALSIVDTKAYTLPRGGSFALHSYQCS